MYRKQLINISIATMLLTTIGLTINYVQAQQFEDHVLRVRAECVKRGTGGCTDHLNDNWVCTDIPAGYMASTNPKTFSVGYTNQYGKATHCPHRFENISTINTAFGPAEVAGRVCLSAHIESGGGGSGIGQTYFNNCEMTYRIAPRQ